MNQTITASILKTREDGSVLVRGYINKCDSEVQSPSGSPRTSDNANWETMTQLELPYTVDSVLSIGKPESGLSYMQAAFFATALEDFLASIRVVGECQSTIRQMKANIDMGKLVAKKYVIAISPFPTDELSGISNENVGCEDFKLNKLINDRVHMETVITDTYKELSVDRSYFQLLKANTDYETKRQRLPSITEEEANNRTLRRKLRRQLRLQQNINAANMDGYCSRVQKLQEQIEEVNLISNVKSRFLNRWQASRIEQQEEFIRREEMSKAEKIVNYKMKQEEEARVHGEMDLLVGILINEMLAEVEDLMLKYEKDTEALETEVQKKRNRYEEMVKEREKLEQQVAHKRQQIHFWSSFKEQRRRRQEYEKNMHHAASVIQAWWRGLLVRHHLGLHHHKERKTKKRKKSTNSNATI